MSAPVTPRYLPGLAAPHGIATVVEVLRDGAIITDPMPVVSGTLVADRTQTIRRSVQSLVFADTSGTLVPKSPSDELAPYGNEIQVSAGITYPDGTQELFSLGIFPISENDIVRGAGYTISVNAFDRSRKISRNVYTLPRSITAGTNVMDAMQAAIIDRLPTYLQALPFTLGTRPSAVTPVLVWATGDDPGSDITSLGSSWGGEWFFDRNGNPVIQPIPLVSGQAVDWTLQGGEGGMLLTSENDDIDDPGFNGSVCDVSNSANTAPIHSETWDTDPSSPTFYLGRYGRVPHILSSDVSALMTSQAQADAATAADLALILGATQTITLGIIPNAAIDEADVATIIDPVTGIDGTYMIQSFSYDLGATTATEQIVCRAVGLLS